MSYGVGELLAGTDNCYGLSLHLVFRAACVRCPVLGRAGDRHLGTRRIVAISIKSEGGLKRKKVCLLPQRQRGFF